jgi:hypothetical protein
MIPKRQLLKRPGNLDWLTWRQEYNGRAGPREPPGWNISWSRAGGSSTGVVATEWLGGPHADDEEFDEPCELAADLWLKEVSRSEAARQSTRIGGSSIGQSPNVERAFLNARVRIIANYFGSNSGLECNDIPGLSFPSIPAQSRYSDDLFNDASECRGTFSCVFSMPSKQMTSTLHGARMQWGNQVHQDYRRRYPPCGS